MRPRIEGIPYEEVLAVHQRHVRELADLPGVQMVGLGAKGILVRTDLPAVIPSTVEGVPVRVEPPLAGTIMGINHTTDQPAPFFRGGVSVADPLSFGAGTLTGLVLLGGIPHVVTAAHILT